MPNSDPACNEFDAQPSRYVVGIDLGTTNCALCFIDTAATSWSTETFRVPQWIDFGQCESRETLPSFHYELTSDERSAGYRLPWQDDVSPTCVGVLARDAGHRHPGRRAASAKSWLSHEGVDRTADLLPWHGDAEVTRLSPVDASARYLDHLRSAWDHAHPDFPLADQDVVITLPASFDEVARELTVAAAKQAGLSRVYLIEEPQAAFYAWIDRQGDEWQKSVQPGQLILVCDIGGGTTDLTLIRVRAAGESGDQIQFHRVAVGDHLILGGDNLDLAIAKLAESKITASEEGSTLSPSQWDRLVQVSRTVKETMLTTDRPDQYTINLPSEGSRLVGGSIQVQIAAEEIDAVLMDGFFPEVDLNSTAIAGESGFQEFGLPYAADAAITRHLAEFLNTHRRTGLDEQDENDADRPALVLFNGGVMSAPAVRERIVTMLSRWFAGDDVDWKPRVLDSPRLDLAVAQGAAYYAGVRRGHGVRIAANLGRSYYMQVADHPPQGLCLIPGTAEAGQRFRAEGHPLELQVGSPVQFPLWVSSTRLADSVGELIEMDRKEASPLPPICTALVQGKRRQNETINVVIEAELSEIGTVGLFCVDTQSSKRWRLEFDIRSTLETDRDAHTGTGEAAGIVDSETVAECAAAMEGVFGDRSGAGSLKPNQLIKRLQTITETHRNAWPPSLLRDQWQFLFDHQQGRRKSAQHESRWLNHVGFCLRPGYGVAVDDWRVSQVWRTVHNKLAFPAASSRTESMILWRRIAGGLTAGQQAQLAAPWISALKNGTRKIEAHEASEAWRLIGSLERLAVHDKVTLGRVAIQALSQKKHEKIRHALLWAIGRLGSRQPLYGPLNGCVGSSEAAGWAESLMRFDRSVDAGAHDSVWTLALVQIVRMTGDRYRDLPVAIRNEVIDYLVARSAPTHSIDLLKNVGRLQSEEEAAIFGDSLPLGIRLVR
ncbi:Chaperone protein DnaK [Novipirellula galeiformis]|uniref:Chaperone protein DnaK n=1 Tax=Novipirellula galeiformis TaxID=2528004 RepID=A0A5C6CNF2_9BACT|nr:hsp70 family protein [Novipirellula galeiformis]TWU24994.1 Chaperone protein DnaK [Novipirellula galeiformis]